MTTTREGRAKQKKGTNRWSSGKFPNSKKTFPFPLREKNHFRWCFAGESRKGTQWVNKIKKAPKCIFHTNSTWEDGVASHWKKVRNALGCYNLWSFWDWKSLYRLLCTSQIPVFDHSRIYSVIFPSKLSTNSLSTESGNGPFLVSRSLSTCSGIQLVQ